MNTSTIMKRALVGTALSAISLTTMAAPAFAQDDTSSVQGDSGTATTGETIIVTGSRIARPEVAAQQPVTILDKQQLDLEGAANVQDIINELPQAYIGTSRTNSNFQVTGAGIATINLRNLGESRTLTLVNGRRFIGGYPGDSAVDINNIPTDLVERVDVVTGGSSAVYGSDAIAGVVNFVMKDSFEGLRLRAQAGITGEGDNPRYMISGTGGTAIGSDDQGNLMFNVTWDRDEGLRSRERAISNQDCFYEICGPGAYSSFPPQGRFQLVNSAGRAQNALPGGTSLFTFDPDNSVVLGFPTGYGFNRNGERYIATPIERYIATGIANFDVSDNINVFGELTYAKVKTNNRLEPFALAYDDVFDGTQGISIDNPFIPQEIQDAITSYNATALPADQVTSLQFRRRQNEVFDRSSSIDRDTWRATIGAKGDLGRFNWEVSGVYGHLSDSYTTQDINAARYAQALSAIPDGMGGFQCADPAAVAAGCLPINLFGYNTVDPAAAAYVVVPASEDVTNKQYVGTASISGPLFELPAGDLAFAVGAEYRKETSLDDLDDLTNTGANSGNQIPDTFGKFDVWEAFGEVSVPILSGTSFFEYFGLTGAARLSDYSTIGQTFSWNAGAEWEVIPGLRFRANYAEANRAPNISELFSAPSETFASVVVPCDGVTATTATDVADACRAIPGVAAAIAANGIFEYTLADIQGINGFVGGNPDLQEETAKTYTVGMVYQPSFLPRSLLTVDYYNIKVEGAIASLGRSYVIEQCLLTGENVYCDNVVRDPNTGFVTRVDGQLINVGGLWSEGIDVGFQYNTPLGISADDTFSINLNYTYLMHDKYQGDPASSVDDFAGTALSPRHKLNARFSYATGPVTFSWQTLFRSGGEYFKDLADSSDDEIFLELNEVDDYMIHDAQIRFKVDENKPFDFYLGVDNVFDKKPQFLPGTPFGTPTGLETSEVFDVFGRRFYAGFTANF